jgi:opacity protein-like surface antigen
MKYLTLLIFCVILTLISFSARAFADDNPYLRFKDYPSQNGSTDTSNVKADPNYYYPKPSGDDSSAPPMRVGTNLRPAYGIGTNVTIYGGVTAFQDGTLKITSPAAPGAEVKGSTQSTLGGVGGIKFGFTWPSFDAIGGDPESFSKPADLIEPSIVGDFFWSGYRYKATGTGTTSSLGVTGSYDGTLKADVNSYTFCVEPTVRFNLGAFRPYIGFGVGGTYVDAGHAHVDGNVGILGLGTASGGQDLTGSSNDFDFSAEALAGAEYFFDKHWALTFDYKFLYIVSPTFHGNIPGSTIKYNLSGLGGSMFTSGISYYF